jgi:hypothetical protein
MQSLKWVDLTYEQKHKNDDQSQLRSLYYPGLVQVGRLRGSVTDGQSVWKSIYPFLYRFGRKGLISMAVFSLSQLPVVGHLVLPAASFYTFNRAVGPGPASIIFGAGLVLPRFYLIVFLQTYFSSRSLMRELLVPYFSRVRFTDAQKKKWFRSREGVLFGFGLGFYILIRVPLVGVLVYGIAEASTAYLITKITDPPPMDGDFEVYTEDQLVWRNKHEFVSMSLRMLDEPSVSSSSVGMVEKS